MMLPPKPKGAEDHTLASRSPTVQAELTALAELAFSFDMDGYHRAQDNDRPRSAHGSRSTSVSTNTNAVSECHSRILNTLRVERHGQQDVTQLAQLATATGLPPHYMFPSHSYGSTTSPEGDPLGDHLDFHDPTFAQGDMIRTQLPRLSSTSLSWLQQALDQDHQTQDPASIPDITPSTTSLDIDDQTEPERASIAVADEKRRRNTAASARFRIKKKLKTVNLERSISDLTGRAEDLEREAADLRRENGWLKEIVMLKHSRFPDPVNHISADRLRSVAGPSSEQSRSRQDDPGSVSDESSTEEQQATAGRKGRTKETRK